MASRELDIPMLEDRLEKLERDNRRLKYVAALVLTCAAAFVSLGIAPSSRIIEAEGFVLRDDSGKVRAILGVSAAGPALSLRDGNGIERVLLAAQANGAPLLRFSDADGKDRAVLTVTPSGPGLSFADSHERVRTALGFLGGEGRLEYYDANGDLRFRSNPSMLGFHWREKSPRIILGGTSVDYGLRLYDAKMKVPASFLVTAVGPVLALQDASGAAALSILRDGPFFGLTDSGGRLLYGKP